MAQKKILFYHPIFLDGGVERTNLLISEELSKKYKIFFASNHFSNKFNSEIKKIGIKKIKLKANRTILSLFEFPKIIKEINPDLILSLQMHANVTILILNFLLFFNKLKIICCERLSPQSYNKNLKGYTLPIESAEAFHVYNQYTIRSRDRDNLKKYLQEQGVGCAIYYPHPLHLQNYLLKYGYKAGDLPRCEKVCNEVLSLPIYPELRQEELNYIVEKLNNR